MWSWVERICRIFLLFCYICIVIGDPIIREGEYCSWRGVLDTTLCDSLSVTFDRLMVFSGYSGFFSINKTDCHNITEILLKVAFNSITIRWGVLGLTALLSNFCGRLKAEPEFPLPFHDRFFVQWIDAIGGCLICWYWCHCWPSLYKLSIHNVSVCVYLGIILYGFLFLFSSYLRNNFVESCLLGTSFVVKGGLEMWFILWLLKLLLWNKIILASSRFMN